MDRLTQDIETATGREKKEKEERQKALAKDLANASWHDHYAIIRIPKHLYDFARAQIPHWTQSAITALCYYQKEVHYDVHDGDIVPIDHSDTGVLQRNMVWSDGLAQMLQIKEGLKIKPEDVSTNYLSTVGFLKRYGAHLYGLTGTLGHQPTRDFFKEEYNADAVVIPPYKHRKVANNSDSKYLCKEFPAIIVATQAAWYQAIVKAILSKVKHGRAVLVIFKYINQVQEIAKRLRAQYRSNAIFTYTGQHTFTKKHIATGEVILATNIAGRGTDIVTSPDVEANGGMHQCTTFLPDSYRVELQNVGRTARQGKRGSAQLIIHDSDVTDIATLRARRDVKEAIRVNRAKVSVADMLLKDQVFSRLCVLRQATVLTDGDIKKMCDSDFLFTQWSKEKASLSDEVKVLEKEYEAITKKYEADIAKIALPEEEKAELVRTFRQSLVARLATFKQERETARRDSLCETSKDQGVASLSLIHI